MRRTMTIRWVVGVFLTLMFGIVPRAHGQVKIIDIIPNDFSDETRHNSEPYIAVNPTNRNIIAVSVFMPTPAASPNGPMLVSFDGGTTWAWRNIIPSSPGAFFNTGDITIRFNTTGTRLYAGILGAGGARSADHPDQRHEPQHADDAAQHTAANRPALHLRADGGRTRSRVGREQRCREQPAERHGGSDARCGGRDAGVHANPNRCGRGRRQGQLSGADDWRSRWAHLRCVLPAQGRDRRRLQRRRRCRPRQRRGNDECRHSRIWSTRSRCCPGRMSSPRRRSRTPLAATQRSATTGGAATSI